MKIVAANHAEARFAAGRPMPASNEAMLLATIGDDLRTLYHDLRSEMPDDLMALAERLDRRSAPLTRAA
ncbi:hypothetical protein [Methylobacterium trifolii]|uniref:Anti-sigma factor NepR domain-containing protein n=1 Tax=Methylobacterium trifolii TaxID=1003092 RepID=A0ABQ4U0N0_9HYPH|nr:hypothetical protein [Methylobacterium trifolii]GJE60336.1 hypothetical protein MPOCJGCO_2447 [Methylobacterium trifolii]